MKSTLNIVFLALFLGSLLSLSSAQQVQSMKLLTPRVGWFATNGHLFWTASGGKEWKDITPNTASKETISSVFFLDTSTGWVLFVHGDKNDQAHFELASTADE